MLITTVDFEEKKEKIEKELNKKFNSNNEFEAYLKKELDSTNIRIILSNILRAMNIINNKDREDSIQKLTEIELIHKINLIDNKNILIKWKDDKNLSRYIKDITIEKLDLIEKLSYIFIIENNIEKIKLLEFSKKENIEKANNKNKYIIIISFSILLIFILFLRTLYTEDNHLSSISKDNNDSNISKDNNDSNISKYNNYSNYLILDKR